MTTNETYVALVAVALLAYALGLQAGRKTAAAQAASLDPLAWLHAWDAV